MAEYDLFLTTPGREFSELVGHIGFEACRADAYQVFSNGLNVTIDYEALSSVTDAGVEASVHYRINAYFASTRNAHAN